MYPYLGDFPTGATIFFPFHTFNSSGASVTLTGLATTDIEVYKGSSMTQRSSDAGYALVDTDGIDLDTITGIHGFTIDTSDNTDSGFYAAGNDYTVVISAVTVDSQTVNFIAGRFSIDNRGLLRPTVATRTLDVASTGEAGLDLSNVNFPVGAIPWLGISDNGTAQAVSGTTIQLRSAAAFPDSNPVGQTVMLTSGSNSGATAIIESYVSATDTATFTSWSGGVSPTGTPNYVVFGTAAGTGGGLDAAGVRSAIGLASANLDTQLAAIDDLVDTEVAAIYSRIGAPVGASISADIAAVQSDTNDIQTRIPAALVSGRIDASVGAMAANVMTAAAAASDLTTELQSGLATAAALSTVAGYLDTEVAAILAAVDTEVASILSLLDDARTEPGQGTPPVNPDLATKIDYLYKAWRNRHTQTASQYTLYGDDGTTVHQKATFSDDSTTADRAEIVSGP
jgi:hypothetical protein